MKNLIGGKNTGEFVILSLCRDEKRIDRIIHHSKAEEEKRAAESVDGIWTQLSFHR